MKPRYLLCCERFPWGKTIADRTLAYEIPCETLKAARNIAADEKLNAARVNSRVSIILRDARKGNVGRLAILTTNLGQA